MYSSKNVRIFWFEWCKHFLGYLLKLAYFYHNIQPLRYYFTQNRLLHEETSKKCLWNKGKRSIRFPSERKLKGGYFPRINHEMWLHHLNIEPCTISLSIDLIFDLNSTISKRLVYSNCTSLEIHSLWTCFIQLLCNAMNSVVVCEC